MDAPTQAEGRKGGYNTPLGRRNTPHGSLEMKEMEQIPIILNTSLMKPGFTDYLGSTLKIRG